MKAYVLIPVALLLLAVQVHGQDGPEAIPLWPDGAPGTEGRDEAESVRVTDAGEHVVTNVHRPSITPYLPESATGAAVIVAPGGGHRELWVDHEGHHVARWLSDHGVAGFVIKYRLARQEDSPYTVDEHSLADMQRAVRLVRSKADQWKIHPQRIGVMGFSAGGEVAGLASMRFDDGNNDASDPVERVSCRPDFQALIYPGRSHRLEPDENSPPAFIVCGYDDRNDISRGMAELYLRFKDAQVPAELHIYSHVGHGFGLRDRTRGAIAGWPERMLEWMKVEKVID